MYLTETKLYGSTDSLTEIWNEFSVLMTMREAVSVMPHASCDDPRRARRPLATVQTALERIEHWMQQTAWRAAGVRAQSSAELSFKIKIMGEYCEDDPDALLHALASSIARDDVLD